MTYCSNFKRCGMPTCPLCGLDFRYNDELNEPVSLPDKDEASTRDELYEVLHDDAAVMRGYRAVQKMLRLRVGSQHDHAEAFRKSLKGEDNGSS